MVHSHVDRDILSNVHRDIGDILRRDQLPIFRRFSMIKAVMTAADCERKNYLHATANKGGIPHESGKHTQDR